MSRARLLLPAASRFGGQRLLEPVAKALGRADAVAGASLAHCFEVVPAGWPAAAVTRQADRGDAADAAWLRADPVHIRPDLTGARLLAHGRAMQVEPTDVDAILPALKPLFDDAGLQLDAPTPARWYLRLPAGTQLPAFSPPDAALGAELLEHLPGGESDSPEARRWRSLLSEVQVVLHNHPRNAERLAQGRPSINSLWFWGAGRLPTQILCACREVLSDDDTVLAFARFAGVRSGALPTRCPDRVDGILVDLRDARDLARVQADWFVPLLEALHTGSLRELRIDCESGDGYRVTASQRWRFWRKPRTGLGA